MLCFYCVPNEQNIASTCQTSSNVPTTGNMASLCNIPMSCCHQFGNHGIMIILSYGSSEAYTSHHRLEPLFIKIRIIKVPILMNPEINTKKQKLNWT